VTDGNRTCDLRSHNPQSLYSATREPRVLQVFYTRHGVSQLPRIGCHRQSDRLSRVAVPTHTAALVPPVAGGVSSTLSWVRVRAGSAPSELGLAARVGRSSLRRATLPLRLMSCAGEAWAQEW